MKVIMRKIFAYDPTFKGKYSRYEGYCRSTLQQESPDINEEKYSIEPLVFDGPIFSSSLKRGYQSAEAFREHYKDKKIVKTELLNEIKFDLKKLVSEKEFEQEGSKLVRKRFIEAFIKDDLSEKRSEIQKRMDDFMKIFSNREGATVLAISHSFFMKILEIYLKDKKLFENPEILLKEFDPMQKTYGFGTGFEFVL